MNDQKHINRNGNMKRKKTIHWHDPELSTRDAASISGLDYLKAIKDGQRQPPPADIKSTKKIFPPMKLDADLCTECGVCQRECLTWNIVMEPSFQFGDNCIFCYNCLRTCDTGAITNDIFDVINDGLRMLASKYSETSGSMIFL